PCVATGFKEKQFRHISYCNIYLKECSESIIEQMKNSYRFFVGQTEDVLRQWQKVIVQVDGDVESALKFAIKSSLQDLSRAINGDGKSDPSPLFKLSMILNLNTGKVDFTPSIVDLIQMIKDVYDQIMQIYKHIPRLGSVLHEDHGGFQVFRTVFDTLCKDSEINSSFVGILEGVSSVTAEMGRLMADWENSYKSIWEADKDIFITRMKDSNQPLEAVDKHITKSECSITKKKKALVEHCKEWQRKFTDLLKSKALSELHQMLTFFELNSLLIKELPNNLEELSAGIALRESLAKECTTMPERFLPLRKMFATLEKFDMQPTEQEMEWLYSLENKLECFLKDLKESNLLVQQKKMDMKVSLQNELERFSHHVENLRQEFIEVTLWAFDKIIYIFSFSMKSGITGLPVQSKGELDIRWAFEVMQRFKNQLEEDKKTAQQIKIGLDIFGIEQPSYKDMQDTEKDLENLSVIWTLLKNWKEKWSQWASLKLANANTKEIDNEAVEYYSNVMKLQKLVSRFVYINVQFENNGLVGRFGNGKKMIEGFRAFVPLVEDLKNPAMRPRHWEKLRKELGRSVTFDPYADDFTLGAIQSLSIHKYAEAISAVSKIADQEKTIENAIKQLEETWTNYRLDMAPYKTDYFKLTNTKPLVQQLEEDQVQLSAMKNYPYFTTFADEICFWVNVLSNMFDTLELVIQLTNQWVYLENIFMGSDEIQKQLAGTI
ncbi:flagellar inner arm dynein 1 heavy chain beta, partial [Reticulomyxa filosa]